MTRAMVGIGAILAALCAVQWTTLRHLKADLAGADARAYRRALLELHDRQDEVARVLVWLDASDRTEESRGGRYGLCQGSHLDVEAIRNLVLDGYLRARASGASETEARELVVMARQNRARR
jgi:hypothetical protein